MAPYTLEETKNHSISTYWWNNGSKKCDFKGTYEEFFKKKNITITEITHTLDPHPKGLQLTIPLSTTKTIHQSFDTCYETVFNDAIRIYLTLLGDKALLETRNRYFRINWG